MFRQPSIIETEIDVVAAFAATADCLTDAYNASNADRESVLSMVDELKHNLHSLPAKEFIQFASSTATRINLLERMKSKHAEYTMLANQLIAPTPEQREQMDKLFSSSYSRSETSREQSNRIDYLLTCFTDYHAEASMTKMLASAAENLSRAIKQDIFPNAFIHMIHDADDKFIPYMLQNGLAPNAEMPWRNFFGDSMNLPLMTHLIYIIGQKIAAAGRSHAEEDDKLEFNDTELLAYQNIIKCLLEHGANPDAGETYQGDDTSPRGFARSKLGDLMDNKQLPQAQKDKMATVLNLIINAQRIAAEPEAKHRRIQLDGGDGRIISFSI